jgi:hypothetical protein
MLDCKWILNCIKEKFVINVDTDRCHSVITVEFPKTENHKKDIQECLWKNCIKCYPASTVPMLHIQVPYTSQDHVANEVGHLVIQLHHYHHWFYPVKLIWTEGGGGDEVAQLEHSLRCCHVVRMWKILFTKSVRMTEIPLTGRTTKGGHLWRTSTSKSYTGMAVDLTATRDDMMIVMSHWLLSCYNCADCACSSRQSLNTSNSFMIKNTMTVFLHYIASFTVSVSLLCVCVCVKTWKSPLLCHYSASVWQHGHLPLSIGSSPCDINL